MKEGSPGWWNIIEASGSWKNIVIASMPQGGDKHLEGMNIADIAKAQKKAPEDTVLDLVASSPNRVSALYFMMCEEDVRTAMKYPWVSVDSDAGTESIETAQAKAIRANTGISRASSPVTCANIRCSRSKTRSGE